MSESEYSVLFIPTRHEARAVFKYLQIKSKSSLGPCKIYHAHHPQSGQKYLLVLSGIGPELASKAAKLILEKYPIREIHIMGVCAATQIGYESGDAFIATEIASENPDNPIFRTHPDLLNKARKIFSKLSQRFHEGRMLTVNRVIESPSEKIELGRLHDCLGLEMEAYAVAEMARQKNIPFLELRWVLDPAEYLVPPTGKFVDVTGEAKTLAALKTFASNPPLLFKMIPFVQKVQQALKNMNQFLHSYFEDERI